MGLSAYSTSTYEEVAESAPNVFLIMQLYMFKKRELAVKMIRRAEKAGYKAIALTVDSPVGGQNIAAERHNFKLPDHLCVINYVDLTEPGDITDDDPSLWWFGEKANEPMISKESLVWLKSVTKLPILLKGILTAEDAQEAVKMGVQGIIVSNHGGRQLDGVASTVSSHDYIVLVSLPVI